MYRKKLFNEGIRFPFSGCPAFNYVDGSLYYTGVMVMKINLDTDEVSTVGSIPYTNSTASFVGDKAAFIAPYDRPSIQFSEANGLTIMEPDQKFELTFNGEATSLVTNYNQVVSINGSKFVAKNASVETGGQIVFPESFHYGVARAFRDESGYSLGVALPCGYAFATKEGDHWLLRIRPSFSLAQIEMM